MWSWMSRNRCKMGVDAARDRATKVHRYCITDQSPQYLEVNLAIFWQEGVVTWKALNDGGFP